MLNNFVLVGRLVENPKLVKEYETIIELAIPRNVKNADGVYETDYISVILYGGVASNTCKYCKKTDLIGVKGRIQRDENKNIQLVAEKITFLNSSKVED